MEKNHEFKKNKLKKILVVVGIILSSTTMVVTAANDDLIDLGLLKSKGRFEYWKDVEQDEANIVIDAQDLHMLGEGINTLNEKVEEAKRGAVSALNDIGTTSVTAESSFQQINDAIRNSQNVTNAPSAAQILTGKQAWANGAKITGNMVNNGSISGTINAGECYIIPKGYHDGNGKITANALNLQTPGTATESLILSGHTAWVNGVKITGTMPDKQGSTQGAGITYSDTTGTVTIPANGYYSTASKLTVDLSEYKQQIQDAALIKVGTVTFNSPEYNGSEARLLQETLDCTGIAGWNKLKEENFFLMPVETQIYFSDQTGVTNDFSQRLGNLNDPAKDLIRYDSSVGILTVRGNGLENWYGVNDYAMVWYKVIDVYVVR